MNSIYRWIDQIWQWISKIVFVRFEFELPLNDLKKTLTNERLILVLTSGGFLDWLILSSWSKSHGLGAILVANRLRILFLSKPLYFFQVLFRIRSYADLVLSKETGPRLIFCPSHERGRHPFSPLEVESILAETHEKMRETNVSKLVFYPTLILWRKHLRGRARQLTEYFLGLSSNPNLFGKVWYLIRKRKDSVVRSLSALSIDSSTTGISNDEFLQIAKSVRRKILVNVNQEMRVVLGPRYYSPHFVIESLLKDPELKNQIDLISNEENKNVKKVTLEVYKNLREIIANYRFRTIEIMYVFLTWLFTKIFDGVELRESEIQTVRETMKTKPVVFVSAHRSHFDYLVIPYVLFLNDMVTPHMVAGINLAFWPLGGWLRSGGAFFIRRGFKGDSLYRMCLRKYIEFLLKSRVNIKFFIEGTRSRSGKMLPPAYGILKMMIEGYQRKAVDDIAFIPVSIVYDEVPEERTYSKELKGENKEKENASALIRSRSVIGKKIGRVYVRFANPLFCKSMHLDRESLNETESMLLLQKMAFSICKAINDVTSITPSSLVATVLLSHPRKKLSLQEILWVCERIGKFVTSSTLLKNIDMGGAFRGSLETSLRRFQRNGTINQISTSVPKTYCASEKNRNILSYYKNNAIHCLTTPAILLISYFSVPKNESVKDEQRIKAIFEHTLQIRNLLKFEFFFSPSKAFIEEVRQTIEFFIGSSVQLSMPDIDRALESPQLKEEIGVYMNSLADLIESYVSVLKALLEMPSGIYEKKALIQKLVKSISSEKDSLRFQESVSFQNYTNALKLLSNRRCVEVHFENDRVKYELLDERVKLRELLLTLSSYQQVIQGVT